MVKHVTADEIVPLIARLSSKERIRLLRLITAQLPLDDAAAYKAAPPGAAEFSSVDEALSWDAEGWEQFD